MISHERRCIFVHVPKCAGTSIEDAIWPGERGIEHLWMGFVSPLHNAYQTGGLQHLTARLIRAHVGEATFNAYYRFAVVRNPWDKAVSQYIFMRERPDLREFAGMPDDAEFKTYLRCIRRREHVQWQPQHTFVCDGDGSLLVHDLVRFEELERGMAAVFTRLAIHTVLPHRKPSERAPLASYYDAEAREMVAELYAEDIRRFGYAFPGQNA